MIEHPYEWTEEEREQALSECRAALEAKFKKPSKTDHDIPKLLAGSCVELEIYGDALRECARRYLDATGRGGYGDETLVNEIRFFRRLAENMVIACNLQRKKEEGKP